MAYENVGLVWTPDLLAKYLSTIEKPSWCKSITLHHMAAPSLAQRPKGLLLQHIENLRHFYQDEKHWSAGPHLFVDEDQLFGMCDFRRKGVHAVSFNNSSIGMEVLGDYDTENPMAGRGLDCWKNAAAATGALLKWLCLDATENTVLFHRDDPMTRKSCPGTKVKKNWILELIATPIEPRDSADLEKPEVGIEWDKWEFCGERWCVPVYDFLVAKGVKSKTVSEKLKSAGGLFFFGTELLEGAYYIGKDSSIIPNQCTWAPVRELMELV